MSDKILTSRDAKRPHETALQRLHWLLFEHPVALDYTLEPVDYRGATSSSVIDDLASPAHVHHFSQVVGENADRLPLERQYLSCPCGKRLYWGVSDVRWGSR